MKKHIRVASGLSGLGLVLAISMGAEAARAESRGTHDDAAKLVIAQPAAAPGAGKTTRVATARPARADDAVLGFTASSGVRSYTFEAVARAPARVGRGDEASLPVGQGFAPVRRSEPQRQATGTGTRPYRAQIEKHARAHGVPVALALAVVRIESNYNPRARGRAGEVGLMQIKPQTARGVGFTGSASALYDPDTNLHFGMKYLAGAYRLAGGDTCGTIMRYQGGHYARRMSKAAAVYCGKVKRHMAGKWA